MSKGIYAKVQEHLKGLRVQCCAIDNQNKIYLGLQDEDETWCNSPVIKDTILRKKNRNYGHESDQKRNKEVQQSRKAVNY